MGTDATPQERLTLIEASQVDFSDQFAEDVQAGLSGASKSLPCYHLYDHVGAQLFEQICRLPEYYLTRAETEILETRAREIVAACSPQTTLVELGSGSARKTRILIEAFLSRQQRLRFVPIDISRTMLEESSAALVEDFPGLEVVGLIGEYDDALEALETESDDPLLVAWLGSTLGNLHRSEGVEFLRRIVQGFSHDDRLLVGIDLRKDRTVLEQAYDDAQGVTARFNRNLLARINRELDGDFDLEAFRHQAVYNEEVGRVELYLESTSAQRVQIDELDMEVAFESGERIHTENSYKYSRQEIEDLASAAGLRVRDQWFDSQRRFSLNLFAPANGKGE